MYLVKKRDRALSQVQNWLNQYPDASRDKYLLFDAEGKRAKIKALPPEPTTEQLVDALDSWANNHCDECGADCDALVRLGDEPGYDAKSIDLCVECLTKALELARGLQP